MRSALPLAEAEHIVSAHIDDEGQLIREILEDNSALLAEMIFNDLNIEDS